MPSAHNTQIEGAKKNQLVDREGTGQVGQKNIERRGRKSLSGQKKVPRCQKRTCAGEGNTRTRSPSPTGGKGSGTELGNEWEQYGKNTIKENRHSRRPRRGNGR